MLNNLTARVGRIDWRGGLRSWAIFAAVLAVVALAAVAVDAAVALANGTEGGSVVRTIAQVVR